MLLFLPQGSEIMKYQPTKKEQLILLLDNGCDPKDIDVSLLTDLSHVFRDRSINLIFGRIETKRKMLRNGNGGY